MMGNYHVRFGKGILTNDFIRVYEVGVNLLFHDVDRSADRYKSVCAPSNQRYDRVHSTPELPRCSGVIRVR